MKIVNSLVAVAPVLAGILVVGLSALLGIQPAASAEDTTRIALKLFGRGDVQGGIGSCRFSLWQDDRDPDKDRYAYLFHTNRSSGTYSGPAWVKTGDTFRSLVLLAEGRAPGGSLPDHFLYATDDRSVRVHIEIKRVRPQAEEYRIGDASLTVVQAGKLPFVAGAKGVYGCTEKTIARQSAQGNTVPAAPPAGLPLRQATLFNDISELPPFLVQTVRRQAGDECDLDQFLPWGGARYVVNETYLLWEVPCSLGAYQGASVLAVTQNPPRDWANLLDVPNLPGTTADTYRIVTLEVLGSLGQIRSTALGRGIGDCGSQKVLRLIDAPGEILELDLLEYREKSDCDGVATEPADWPLVFQSY